MDGQEGRERAGKRERNGEVGWVVVIDWITTQILDQLCFARRHGIWLK